MSNSLDPDQARHFFSKFILSGIPSECQTVWFRSGPTFFFQKNSVRNTWSIRVSNSLDPDQARHFFQKNSFRNTISVKQFGSRSGPAFFFQKISFRNTIRVSNSLDPDQARHFFKIILSGIPSECQTVWIQIRPDILFKRFLSEIPSECQTVWIQIRPDIMSGLIWVQTVYKGYQQTRLAGKGLRTEIKDESLCQQN